jgi:amino acid adenylation domain-containing protein
LSDPRPMLAAPIPDGEHIVVAPLTYAQERLWLHAQLNPTSAMYNIPLCTRLRGTLDLAALEDAFRSVIARHAALRTGIVAAGGVPVQQVHAEVAFRLGFADLTDAQATGDFADLSAPASALALAEVRRPFDLTAPPLLRASVTRIGPTDHVLTTVIHHLMSDTWSCAVLTDDLNHFYRARVEGVPDGLPALAVQYPDFAEAQRRLVTGEVLERRLDYWRSQLDGMETLRFPAPQGGRRPTEETGISRVELSARTLARVRALGRQERCTDFMVLLSAVQLLLSRYTGQGDITVAAPVSQRSDPAAERSFGFFANTVLLRCRIERDESFRSHLVRNRYTVLDGFDAAIAPVERLATTIGQGRDLSDQSLYRAMFNLQNTAHPRTDFAGCTAEPFSPGPLTTDIDLNLNAVPVDGGLAVDFTFRLGALAPELVSDLGESFCHLLDQALDDPDRAVGGLDALAPARRRQVVVAWNAEASTDPVGGTVLDRLERVAAARGDATAVECGGDTVSYSELWARSGELAAALVGLGVTAEETAAVVLDPGVDFVVALVGVLRSGGAVVPVDPALPRDRVDAILDVARARVLVTGPGDRPLLADRPERRLDLVGGAALPDGCTGEPPRPGPDQLAYVIFTSGTTGSPKGVEVEHRALANVIEASRAFFGVGPDDRCLQIFSLGFDPFLAEIFTALTAGATLVVPPLGARLDVARVVRSHQVTFAIFPTSLLGVIDPATVPTLHTVVVGGEPLPEAAARPWRSRVRLVNAYGPTEAAIIATLAEVDVEGTPHIGRPIRGMQAFVLDELMMPVPVGVAGLLHLGGVGLARGYRGQPELTAQAFCASPLRDDPSLAARLYRTGDVARYREDATLEVLGRTDRQVKLRGHRIEPGDIEAHLRSHPHVQQAAVVVVGSGESKRLVAHAAVGRARADGQELRAYLTGRLPGYMVPSVVAVTDALPVGTNGKVDVSALVAASELSPATLSDRKPGSPTPPRDATEDVIATIWRDFLPTPALGVDDDFFEQGGHSLLAMRVLAQVNDAFQIDLPLRAMFEAPTVADLANVVRADLMVSIAALSDEEATALLREEA